MDLVTLPLAVRIASFYGMALAAGLTEPGNHTWKVRLMKKYFMSLNPLSTNRTDMYEKHQQCFENLQLSQIWRYDRSDLLPRQSDKFWSV